MLYTGGLPEGQWVIIRPMSQAHALFGILPFGEDLLFVGKCTIYLLLTRHSPCFHEGVTERDYWTSVFVSHAACNNDVPRD